MSVGSVSEEILKRVRTVVEPILSAEGVDFVDLEYRREGRGWVLRIFIDKEGGVTLDDCTRVSREVGRSLDVEEVFSTPYTLEVSSPGLNRPLRREEDFVRYTHRLIRLKTVQPVEERRNFRGKLLGVKDQQVAMEVEGRVYQISLSNISKANLEIEF